MNHLFWNELLTLKLSFLCELLLTKLQPFSYVPFSNIDENDFLFEHRSRGFKFFAGACGFVQTIL